MLYALWFSTNVVLHVKCPKVKYFKINCDKKSCRVKSFLSRYLSDEVTWFHAHWFPDHCPDSINKDTTDGMEKKNVNQKWTKFPGKTVPLKIPIQPVTPGRQHSCVLFSHWQGRDWGAPSIPPSSHPPSKHLRPDLYLKFWYHGFFALIWFSYILYSNISVLITEFFAVP